MESVLGRYRNLIILVGVLFLQVLGLAVQVKRAGSGAETTGHDTRLIRIWAVGAVTPFERGLLWIQNGAGNLWHNYFYLRGVRAENRELKAQIEQMRIEQVRLSEDAAQARRLQNLLSFKEQYISKTVAAQVIGSSGSDLSRVIYIDKGENAGIKRDMAVITSDGIVGKVLMVYPTVAQVLLISDQSSGVGAILEKSRLQGVLRGTPNGEVTLERVMSDEQVQAGENLMTSGGDQIFPKGLPVGTVTKVTGGKDLFLNIRVRPAANLSKLEEVLVLVEKQERQATAEDSIRVRAADILAQRLPSVPDKPAGTSTPNSPDGSSKPADANLEAKPGTTPVTASGGVAKNPAVVLNTPTGTVAAKKPSAPATVSGAQTSATGKKESAKPLQPQTPSSLPASTEQNPAPPATQPDSQLPDGNSPQ